MSITGFIVLLIVAAIAGRLGQAIAGFSRGGCIASIVVGFVGSYLSWWLAQQFGLPPILVINVEGQQFPLVWAVIGSALFAAILSLLAGRRVYY